MKKTATELEVTTSHGPQRHHPFCASPVSPSPVALRSSSGERGSIPRGVVRCCGWGGVARRSSLPRCSRRPVRSNPPAARSGLESRRRGQRVTTSLESAEEQAAVALATAEGRSARLRLATVAVEQSRGPRRRPGARTRAGGGGSARSRRHGAHERRRQQRPWRGKEEVRERFGGEVGGTPRAGGGMRDPTCPSMREDTILHRVDAHRFRFGNGTGASPPEATPFCKITTIQTRDTDALYAP
jgi:hypothetical protein